MKLKGIRPKGLHGIIIQLQDETLHWIKSLGNIIKNYRIKEINETDSFKCLMGYARFLSEQISGTERIGSEKEKTLIKNLQEKSSYLTMLNGRSYTRASLIRAINAFQSAHQKIYDYYLHRE